MPRSADYRRRAMNIGLSPQKLPMKKSAKAAYRSPHCWKHWLKTRSSEKKRSNSQRRRPPRSAGLSIRPLSTGKNFSRMIQVSNFDQTVTG
jgi:hypothetical protein